MYNQGIKPAKLTWTLAWRRLHKKGTKEEGSRTRRRRTVRTQRAIAGLSVEEMAKKAAAKPTLRAAAKDNALKEAQERFVSFFVFNLARAHAKRFFLTA